MIVKKDDNNVVVIMGTGDIAVDTGSVEERGPNKPTDVIFSQMDEPRPIGVLKENHAVCTDELKNPVILRFTKVESVAVVISALLKVQESLVDYPIEIVDDNEQS